jgi:hypothetical protein
LVKLLLASVERSCFSALIDCPDEARLIHYLSLLRLTMLPVVHLPMGTLQRTSSWPSAWSRMENVRPTMITSSSPHAGMR